MKTLSLLTLAALLAPLALTSCGNSSSSQSASAATEDSPQTNATTKPLKASLEFSCFNAQHSAADLNVAGNIASITDSVFSTVAANGNATRGDFRELNKYTFDNANLLMKKYTYSLVYSPGEEYIWILNYEHENGRMVSCCAEAGDGCETCEYGDGYIIHWQGDGRDSLILADGRPVKDVIEGEVMMTYEFSYTDDGFTRYAASYYDYETDQEVAADKDKDVMTFNKYGRLTSHVWQAGDDVCSYTCQYDENGDLTRETRDLGFVKYDVEYTYSDYDAHGNWHRCVTVEHSAQGEPTTTLTLRTIVYRE